MRSKKRQEQRSTSGTARITPVEIQQAEFRLAFRGYNERDVDAFLDRVTEDLSSYLEENQRLQAMPRVGATSAGQDQAADIIARARSEAAAIIRAAEDEAAAVRASAQAVGGGDARSAVAPFLNKEREFLQGLGSLVQTHAEEIKGMVLAIRARSEAAQSEAPPPTDVRAEDAGASAASRSKSERPSTALEPASSTEIRSRLGFEPETMSMSEGTPGDDDETVIVESATEPVYTTDGSPANERRERSLRELFWGEE